MVQFTRRELIGSDLGNCKVLGRAKVEILINFLGFLCQKKNRKYYFLFRIESKLVDKLL